MNIVNDRIKKYFAYKGWNISEVENDCGFKKCTLRVSLNRDSSLTSDKILRILETYEDLSAEWLLRGEGCMLKE